MNNIKTKVYTRKKMLFKSIIDLKKTYKGEYLINLLRAKNFLPHEFVDKGRTFSINVNIKEIKKNKLLLQL